MNLLNSRLRCILCAVILLWAASASSAQSAKTNATPANIDTPIVRSTLSQSNVVPGEAVTLQITVLVPTWLTKPVEFPTIDRPNLSVSAPDKSSVSTSETINGTTWSGVVREYLLVPLTPGVFRLPATSLDIRYRNPDGGPDITRQATLAQEPITLTASAPEGAEALDPYIAADNLNLEQRIEGTPENLKPGDSFSRTVTASIQGSTVMFVPALLTTDAPSGLAAYADTPRTNAQSDGRVDGENGGSRVEKITYVAETPLKGTLPAITLSWYDLKDGDIKTTTLKPVKVHVKGVAAISGLSPAHWLGLLALGIALLWLAREYLWPTITQVRAQYHQRREAAGTLALRQLQSAIKHHNYSVALNASMTLKKQADYATSDIPQTLFALGQAHYGNTPASASAAPLWQKLELATDAYVAGRRRRALSSPLPPLNPP
ncbi:BatD family protein [Microbulbifer sp. HZ11]|uniref:BatD family protein n=1 Tax=Microbulbifer sp. HZ11 TaxID=1453501 RepID=UPI0005BDA37A|nr:BatD family protein [Microbulbifer sp. HZ11]